MTVRRAFTLGEAGARRLRLPLAGAALAVGLLLPAPARAQEQEPFYGVSGNRSTEADYRMMKEVGVSSYRALFHLRRVIHRRGQFVIDWEHFDRIVAGSQGRGMELIPQLWGWPHWSSDADPRPPVRTREERRLWRQLLIRFVQRYGPNGSYWFLNLSVPYNPVRTWQIWNEQNSVSFFAPRPSAREYAELLRISAEAIRSVDPGAKIISGGIVAEPRHPRSIRGPIYIRQLLRQPGVIDLLDAIALHPYARSAEGVRHHLRRARRAINRGGARRLPIWITEVGWASRPGGIELVTKGPRRQARALRRSFAMVRRVRGRLRIERLLWFQWRDIPNANCEWCRWAGLVTWDRRPKPALWDFRRAALADR